MHSATAPTGHRDAILSTAIDLIAQHGVASVTVRQVAGSLDVSPPLILHHFGSRQGLIDACDHQVREALQHVLERLEFDHLEASMQALLADPELGSALDYVARSLCDRGPVGQWWLDQVLDLSLDAHHRMVADGSVRAVHDDEMTVVLMVTMELGMFMLRPLLEARLGASLTAPEVLERWTHTEIDLLTNGYLTDGESGRDQNATVTGEAQSPDDSPTTGRRP